VKITVEIPDCATPGQHGVYVCFDGNGDVLYIGRTKDLGARLKGHRSQSAWWRQLRSVEFSPCDGPNEARVVEKSMIATFRPEANVNDWRELPSTVRHTLPSWTVAKLVEMHEAVIAAGRHGQSENATLNGYILALREAGWSLASIGAALSMTREAVRLRQARAESPHTAPGVPPLPQKPVKPKKVRPSVPPTVLQELRQLQPLATSVRGWTPHDDPARAASERYTEILADQYLSGVSVGRIAKQLGVTHLAVRARLARHGYIEPVKGLKNVPFGTPGRRGVACKAGHALEGDNVRLINGDPRRRVCKTCERRRVAKYRASLPRAG
jgi:hypothetical protein